MSKQQWIKENLKKGEDYGGFLLGQDGKPDYHLVVLQGELARGNWEKAKKYAADAGGELPDRREARLLAINIPQHFNKGSWYWTSAQFADNDGYAWFQDFSDGLQDFYPKSCEYRARAVRRILMGII